MGTPPAASTRTGLPEFAVVLGRIGLLTRGTYDAETRSRPEDPAEADAGHHQAVRGDQPADRRQRVGASCSSTTFQSYRHRPPALGRPGRRADIDAITRRHQFHHGGWVRPTTRRPATRRRTGANRRIRRRRTKRWRNGRHARSTLPPSRRAPDDRRLGDALASGAATKAGLPARTSVIRRAWTACRWPPSHGAEPLTFIVENHGSFGPHYQEELWRTAGKRRPLPARRAGAARVLTDQPNAGPLAHPCSR